MQDRISPDSAQRIFKGWILNLPIQIQHLGCIYKTAVTGLIIARKPQYSLTQDEVQTGRTVSGRKILAPHNGSSPTGPTILKAAHCAAFVCLGGQIFYASIPFTTPMLSRKCPDRFARGFNVTTSAMCPTRFRSRSPAAVIKASPGRDLSLVVGDKYNVTLGGDMQERSRYCAKAWPGKASGWSRQKNGSALRA